MKNIDLLKDRLEVKTSEELFDIVKPPEHQCSNINSIIKNLKYGLSDLRSYIRDLEYIEEVKSLASDIDSACNYFELEDEIEKLRDNIELLREWGQGWKSIAKSLLNKENDEEVIFSYFSEKYQTKYNELCTEG